VSVGEYRTVWQFAVPKCINLGLDLLESFENIMGSSLLTTVCKYHWISDVCRDCDAMWCGLKDKYQYNSNIVGHSEWVSEGEGDENHSCNIPCQWLSVSCLYYIRWCD